MVVMAVFWNNHFIRFAVWLLEKICCRVIILLPINVGVRILRKCGRSARSNIWFQMVNIYMSMKFTLIGKKYFKNLSFNSNIFSYPKLHSFFYVKRMKHCEFSIDKSSITETIRIRFEVYYHHLAVFVMCLLIFYKMQHTVNNGSVSFRALKSWNTQDIDCIIAHIYSEQAFEVGNFLFMLPYLRILWLN